MEELNKMTYTIDLKNPLNLDPKNLTNEQRALLIQEFGGWYRKEVISLKELIEEEAAEFISECVEAGALTTQEEIDAAIAKENKAADDLVTKLDCLVSLIKQDYNLNAAAQKIAKNDFKESRYLISAYLEYSQKLAYLVLNDKRWSNVFYSSSTVYNLIKNSIMDKIERVVLIND